MAGVLLTLKLLMTAAILGAGGMAFWRWRETAKQTWISIGSLDGFIDSAGYFVETVRPVNSLAAQTAHPK